MRGTVAKRLRRAVGPKGAAHYREYEETPRSRRRREVQFGKVSHPYESCSFRLVAGIGRAVYKEAKREYTRAL